MSYRSLPLISNRLLFRSKRKHHCASTRVSFMKDRFLEYKETIAAFTIAVPFTATVWLFAVPHTMSAVTFVGLALLAMGAALVAVNTWSNGQATGTIGHVLNRAEATTALPPHPTAVSDAGRRV